jgi:hypothetical protein
LLYPKADAQRRIIVYACRICQYNEIVENQLVYRNDLLTVTKCVCLFLLRMDPSADRLRREQVGITTDLGADATLVHDSFFWHGKWSLSLFKGSFKYPMSSMWSWWVRFALGFCPWCDCFRAALCSIKISQNAKRHEWSCSSFVWIVITVLLTRHSPRRLERKMDSFI